MINFKFSIMSILIKSAVYQIPVSYIRPRRLSFIIYSLLMIFSSLSVSGCGNVRGEQDSMARVIQQQLKKIQPELYFPNTVARFYSANANHLNWVFPDSVKAHGWEALLMLDCVTQFGLSHDDYHPGQLLSIEMHRLIRNYDSVPAEQKAVFDIMLTDAMLTFINNLHYGKLNPNYNARQLDRHDFVGFKADCALRHALRKKDFMTAVLGVQPQGEAYRRLQSRMRLITGQYAGDCYEVPDGDVRKIAINMERLRWSGNETMLGYIEINIPSNSLRLQLRDTSYQFHLSIDTTNHQTFATKSEVNRFELYTHNGISSIRLYLGKRQTNRQSYTVIRDAENFAKLLLGTGGNTEKINTANKALTRVYIQKFTMKIPVPLQVTYLTCADIDGMLVFYNDIYQIDKGLEKALYAKTISALNKSRRYDHK